MYGIDPDTDAERSSSIDPGNVGAWFVMILLMAVGGALALKLIQWII